MYGTQIAECKLTKNPFGDSSTHTDIFFKCLDEFEKRIAHILSETRRIQGLTHPLSNCDTEIIELPSSYLPEEMSGLLKYTDWEAHQ